MQCGPLSYCSDKNEVCHYKVFFCKHWKKNAGCGWTGWSVLPDFVPVLDCQFQKTVPVLLILSWLYPSINSMPSGCLVFVFSVCVYVSVCRLFSIKHFFRITVPRILTLVLLNPDMFCFANSVAPDQLASEEANWSGSALFAIMYVNLYQQSGSNSLIGWKLEMGVAA